MNKLSTFYEKHKDAILIIVGIIVISIVCTVVYLIAHNQTVNRITDNIQADKNHVIAKSVITGNDIGIVKLVSTNDGKNLSSIKLKQAEDARYIYSKSKDFKNFYAYGTLDNKFYEVSVKNNKMNCKILADLKDKQIDILEFKVDGDNIFALTTDKKTINIISMKDNSIKPIQLKIPIDNWVVTNNIIVYSYGQTLYNRKISDNSSIQINLGDQTTALLTLNDGSVIDFNKFGSGKNTSITMKINPDNLEIKDLLLLDNANVYGLTNDNEDRNIYMEEVIQDNNKPVQVIGDIATNKMSKDSVSIYTQKDANKFKYDQTNSLTAKGYIYSLVNNNIEIVNTLNQQIVRTIHIDNKMFMPVMQ